jgi:hypothetical protein
MHFGRVFVVPKAEVDQIQSIVVSPFREGDLRAALTLPLLSGILATLGV